MTNLVALLVCRRPAAGRHALARRGARRRHGRAGQRRGAGGRGRPARRPAPDRPPGRPGRRSSSWCRRRPTSSPNSAAGGRPAAAAEGVEAPGRPRRSGRHGGRRRGDRRAPLRAAASRRTTPARRPPVVDNQGEAAGRPSGRLIDTKWINFPSARGPRRSESLVVRDRHGPAGIEDRCTVPGPRGGGPRGLAPAGGNTRASRRPHPVRTSTWGPGHVKPMPLPKRPGRRSGRRPPRTAAYVVAAGKDRSVRCIDMATGQVIWSQTFPGPVTALAVTPDGERVAATGEKVGYSSGASATGRRSAGTNCSRRPCWRSARTGHMRSRPTKAGSNSGRSTTARRPRSGPASAPTAVCFSADGEQALAGRRRPRRPGLGRGRRPRAAGAAGPAAPGHDGPGGHGRRHSFVRRARRRGRPTWVPTGQTPSSASRRRPGRSCCVRGHRRRPARPGRVRDGERAPDPRRRPRPPRRPVKGWADRRRASTSSARRRSART